MKTIIFALTTLTLLSTATLAENKPNVPTNETRQIFKAAYFKKQNMAGKVTVILVKLSFITI